MRAARVRPFVLNVKAGPAREFRAGRAVSLANDQIEIWSSIFALVKASV
jgi:hypothetical protein